MSTSKTRNKTKPTAATFAGHIRELRTRLMVTAVIFLVLSAVAYNFRDILIAIVRKPIGDEQLVYLTPAGGFSFIFSITLYAAMLVTAPILVQQVYQFVKPALPPMARRYSWQIFIASMLLMVAGVLFGYFFAVPAALQFLTTFAGDVVVPNLTAESYLNFFMAYIGGLGILFQLPLLLIFWNWLSPLGPKKLLGSERFVIAGSFIVAAMITPTPDMFNQAMVAAPIIVIYQLGALAVLVINKRRKLPAKQPAETKTAKEAVAVPARSLVAPVSKQVAPAQATVKPASSSSSHRRPVRRIATPASRPVLAMSRPQRASAPTMQRVVRSSAATSGLPVRTVHRSIDGISYSMK